MTSIGVWLRRHRERAGLTQAALAELVGRERRWLLEIENGRSEPEWSELLTLAEAVGGDLRGLLSGANNLSLESGMRRNLTSRLGTVPPGAVDFERLADAYASGGRVDARVLEDLGELTRLFAAEHGPQIRPGALLPALRDHLGRLAALLATSQSEATRRRLQGIAAEAALIAGRLAHRIENRAEAAGYLRTGYDLALEAGERWLKAAALAHIGDLHSGISYLGTQGGNTVAALAYMDRAAALDSPDLPTLLRAWLFGCQAEELATLGDQDRALRAIDAAQEAVQVPGPLAVCSTVDIRPGEAIMCGFVGATELALGRTEEAIEAFSLGEATRPGAKAWLSGMAAGYAMRGEVELACDLLARELPRATARGASGWRRRIEGVRQRHLQRWATSPVVRHLDEQLTLVG